MKDGLVARGRSRSSSNNLGSLLPFEQETKKHLKQILETPFLHYLAAMFVLLIQLVK